MPAVYVGRLAILTGERGGFVGFVALGCLGAPHLGLPISQPEYVCDNNAASCNSRFDPVGMDCRSGHALGLGIGSTFLMVVWGERAMLDVRT